MKKNMNAANRIVRVVIGLAVIGVGVYYKSWFGALGLIPLLSAATGYCPLCCGGKSCCETKKDEPSEHKHGDGCCH